MNAVLRVENVNPRFIKFFKDVLLVWGPIITGGNYNTCSGILNGFKEESNTVRAFNQLLSFYSDELDELDDFSFEWNGDVAETESVLNKYFRLDRLDRELGDIIRGLKESKYKSEPNDDSWIKNHIDRSDYLRRVQKKFGAVFTPRALVNDMLGKLPQEVWSNPDLLWLDPACGSGNFLLITYERLMRGLEFVIPDEEERRRHILENMLYGVDIQHCNCFLAIYRLKMHCRGNGNYRYNIACNDSLNFKFCNRFDVVMGNPPFNDASGNRGKGHNLWSEFVILADKLVRKGGYICFVNPSLWRSPGKDGLGHPLQKYILGNDLQYLEIHDSDDAKEIFGTSTRYDWYVLRKAPPTGKTIVKEYGASEGREMDLRGQVFIPNCDFELVQKLLAKDGEDKVKIIRDRTAYATENKKLMSKTKDDTFKYPCVYMVRRNGDPVLMWASKNDRGHFGIKKVVYGGGSGTGVFVDDKGEYGLTEWASGVVDLPDNLEKIALALLSPKFEDFCKRSLWVRKNGKDTDVLRLFRKDFWKEFSPPD